MSEDLVEELTQEEEVKEPEEAPTEETKEEEPLPEAAKEEKDTVPLATLVEERKEWQRKLKQSDERQKELSEKFQTLASQLDSLQKPEPEKVPSYDEDPAAYLKWQNEKISKKQDEFDKKTQTFEERQKQQDQLNDLLKTVQSHERSFVQDHGDYYDALNFVRQKQMNIYKLQGFDDKKAQEMLNYAELAGAQSAIQNEISPAEWIYQVAKEYGFNPANGSNPEAEEKMEKLEKGMKAAQTLGTGAMPSGDELESMELPEFHAAMKAMFGK